MSARQALMMIMSVFDGPKSRLMTIRSKRAGQPTPLRFALTSLPKICTGRLVAKMAADRRNLNSAANIVPLVH
jgi:hypothetical protein